MQTTAVLTQLFRFRTTERRGAAEMLDSEQPVRLPPTIEPHELPPEFEDVVEIQVLGYRERLTIFHGHRFRVLDPIWTLVPRDQQSVTL
ncbi:MAG: hypothetical protein JOY64_10460 [Alphaproteobacteria bacterium]|nr:hypothetical protein [Alphaproteobacteria bacterium]MBV8408041.1 hypothetical protein [Alphaproteobacteria bacterium]